MIKIKLLKPSKLFFSKFGLYFNNRLQLVLVMSQAHLWLMAAILGSADRDRGHPGKARIHMNQKAEDELKKINRGRTEKTLEELIVCA